MQIIRFKPGNMSYWYIVRTESGNISALKDLDHDVVIDYLSVRRVNPDVSGKKDTGENKTNENNEELCSFVSGWRSCFETRGIS